MTADDWRRFASDLQAHAGVSAAFQPDSDPDGLHVLRINGTEFFLNADGSGYDGWGCHVSDPVEPDRN